MFRAVERIARANEDDEELLQEVRKQIDELKHRVGLLEGREPGECPSCRSEDAALNARQQQNQIFDIQFSAGNNALEVDTEIGRFSFSRLAQ